MPDVIHGNFEWDETKNLHNLHKHGLLFEEAVSLFLQYRYISPEIEHPTGEIRFFTVGLLQEREFTVVYTERNSRKRLISFRRSSDDERNIYRDFCAA